MYIYISYIYIYKCSYYIHTFIYNVYAVICTMCIYGTFCRLRPRDARGNGSSLRASWNWQGSHRWSVGWFVGCWQIYPVNVYIDVKDQPFVDDFPFPHGFSIHLFVNVDSKKTPFKSHISQKIERVLWNPMKSMEITSLSRCTEEEACATCWRP